MHRSFSWEWQCGGANDIKRIHGYTCRCRWKDKKTQVCYIIVLVSANMVKELPYTNDCKEKIPQLLPIEKSYVLSFVINQSKTTAWLFFFQIKRLEVVQWWPRRLCKRFQVRVRCEIVNMRKFISPASYSSNANLKNTGMKLCNLHKLYSDFIEPLIQVLTFWNSVGKGFKNKEHCSHSYNDLLSSQALLDQSTSTH